MIAPVDGSLAAWFERVYRPRRLLGRAETTRRRYHCVLRQFGRFLEREPRVSDLTETPIQEFLAWYFETRGVVPITVNTARSHLLALARFAHAKGFLEEVPDISQLPVDRGVPEAWTIEELAQLSVACRGCSGKVAGIPARLYWDCVVWLLYDTGVRCGALWQLRQADVDLERAAILIRPETQKQRAGQWQPFSKRDTLPLVRAIWLPQRELLFPWELHYTSRWNHFARILRRAGLPHTRRDKFHKIRRSHASYVDAGGGDATASLGHSSPAVTRGYLDPRICNQDRPVDLLPRPEL